MADVVAGLLSGSGSASAPGYEGSFGTLLVAVKVATVADSADFTREVEQLRDRLHATEPVPDAEGVLVPGEPEWATRADRLEHGIALASATRVELDGLAAGLGHPPLPA